MEAAFNNHGFLLKGQNEQAENKRKYSSMSGNVRRWERRSMSGHEGRLHMLKNNENRLEKLFYNKDGPLASGCHKTCLLAAVTPYFPVSTFSLPWPIDRGNSKIIAVIPCLIFKNMANRALSGLWWGGGHDSLAGWPYQTMIELCRKLCSFCEKWQMTNEEAKQDTPNIYF